MRNAIIGQVPRRPSWSQRTGYSASPLLQDTFNPDAGLPGISQGPLSPLNSQINGLQGLQDRVRMAGQGMLLAGRAAFGVDEANRQQALSAARSRLVEPMAGMPNRMSPLTGAVSGGAAGAGVVQRYRPGSPLAQLAMSPGVQMTPDRGLGSVIASRYGEEPLVFNRQMTDQQAMDKAEREGKAFTRISDALGGVRAYTSRRQAAEDRLAALQASGASGGEIDDAFTAVRKLKEQDAAAMGRYRADQQKFRDINGIPDGMSERGFREQQRRVQAGRKYMLENKLSPKNPLAQAMFPETLADSAQRSQQAARGQTGGTSSPLKYDAQSVQQGVAAAQERAKTSPFLQSLQIPPESKPYDVIKAAHKTNFEVTPSDARDLKTALVASVQAAGPVSPKDGDPFGLSSARSPLMGGFNAPETELLTDMFKELLTLPDDDKSLGDWSQRFNKRRSSLDAAKLKRAELERNASTKPANDSWWRPKISDNAAYENRRRLEDGL